MTGLSLGVLRRETKGNVAEVVNPGLIPSLFLPWTSRPLQTLRVPVWQLADQNWSVDYCHFGAYLQCLGDLDGVQSPSVPFLHKTVNWVNSSCEHAHGGLQRCAGGCGRVHFWQLCPAWGVVGTGGRLSSRRVFVHFCFGIICFPAHSGGPGARLLCEVLCKI